MNGDFVFVVVNYGLILRMKTSELRTERRTQENRWQTDVPTAGIFWVLLATTKLGTKSAFWVPQGLSMHGPDQGCRTTVSAVSRTRLSVVHCSYRFHF